MMRNSLKKAYILFFLLIFTEFCGLLPLNSLGIFNTVFTTIGLVALNVFALLIIVLKHKTKIEKDKTFSKIIIWGLVYFVFLAIVSLFRYSDQTLFSIFKSNLFLFIFLSFFIFKIVLQTKEDGVFLLRTLIAINVIICLLSLLQVVLFPNGFIFVNQALSSSTRNGNVRFTIARSYTPVVTLISLVCLLNSRKHLFIHVSNIILSVATMVFVNQTRSVLLFCFIAIMLFWALKEFKLQESIFKIVLLILVFSVAAFLLKDYYLNNILDSSIKIRIKAYDYYLEQFGKSPIIGYGIADQNVIDSEYYVLVRGTDEYGQFYIEDVGVVGWIFQTGIIGFIFYFLIMLKTILISKKLVSIDQKSSNIVLVVSMYYLLGSINLFAIQNIRMGLFVLFISYADFLYRTNVTQDMTVKQKQFSAQQNSLRFIK